MSAEDLTDDTPHLNPAETTDATIAGPHAGPLASHPLKIGAYRILGRLGEGGMGIVYRAEQDQPRRQVALKVIGGNYLSQRQIERFQHESAVLARLQHPGIAQIFAAGTCDDDSRPQPYFAMELIAGQELTRYATERRLDTRRRLSLLAKVCSAVEHAHQKGVIHRDLKPANILVDEAGQPKVLDFGVARLTDDWEGGVSARTSSGQIVGTVPYMSPEQVQGDPDILDTRSDVYSLGVVGYELLAGRLPHEVRGLPVPEALRTILDDEPPSLAALDRAFRGDLATIMSKALDKDKSRRYQSAADFARDIDRFLRDEPILARPATAWYQFTKFARRNRILVTAAAIVIASLVSGIVGTSWALVYAQNQAVLAVTEKENAQQAERARAAEAAVALARAAQLSARHGQWKEATAQYDQALALGHADEIELRLGRLRCYFALNNARAAADEIAALSKQADLGRHEGQVLLYKSMLADAAGSGVGNASALRKEALAKGLPPAEAAYARSFEAQTFPEAVVELEEALRHDPYHVDSHERLFVLYHVLGRTDKGKEMLVRLQLIEPRAAFLSAGQAIVQMLAGDLKGAARSADELERLGAKEDAAFLRFTLPIFDQAGGIVRVENPQVKMAELIGHVWKVSSATLQKMGLEGSSPEALAGAQLLNYPLMGRMIRHVGAYYVQDSLGFRSAAANEWGEVARMMPEANILYFHGTLLLNAGKLEEAEKTLLAASSAPALIDNRRQTYTALISAQWELGSRAADRRPECLARARENVDKLLRYYPLTVTEMATLIPLLMETRPALTLALMEQWAQQDPHDLLMLNARSIVESKLGAHERAFRTTGELLRRGGDNKQQSLARFRAQMLSRMRGELAPDFDWLDAAGLEIDEYSATVKLAGDAEDANAAPVPVSTTASKGDDLNGDWVARIHVAAGPAGGYTYPAQVKCEGDRLTIELGVAGGSGVMRKITARRSDQRLFGWQWHASVGKDMSPWVGLIVDRERIDGAFPAGRFDLRRNLTPASPAP